MNSGNDLKMYTMRNFLFYLGVTCTVCVALSLAVKTLGWSNGVHFAVVATAGLAISIFSMREGLLAPAKPSNTSRGHRHRA